MAKTGGLSPDGGILFFGKANIYETTKCEELLSVYIEK